MSDEGRKLKARYLNIKGAYELLNAYYEDVESNTTEEVVTKHYINGDYKNKKTNYNWDFTLEYSDIKNPSVVNYFHNVVDRHFDGIDIESDCVIVDLNSKSETRDEYMAQKFNMSIKVSKDSVIFLNKGNPTEGTFDNNTKIFTKE